MIHQHTPISTSDDIVCKTCGVVLAQAFEIPEIAHNPIFLQELQTIANRNKSGIAYSYSTKSANEKYYMDQTIKVYLRLMDLSNKRYLPKSFANEAMRIILARKKGLWSYKWQIMTLIQVLQNIDSVRFKNHIRYYKEVYKNAKGT